MKSNKIIPALLAASLMIFSASDSNAEQENTKVKNLITNGDFSSKLKLWRFTVTSPYGQKIKPEITKKSFQLNGLVGKAPHYLFLSQYINIEKGKEYKISFEMKTSEKISGKFNYYIGRPYITRVKKGFKGYDHTKKTLNHSSKWTKVTSTFIGSYDTDNSGLAGKRYKHLEIKKEWAEKEKDTMVAKAPTWITFNLGDLTGDFHLRNVTITEVLKVTKEEE